VLQIVKDGQGLLPGFPRDLPVVGREVGVAEVSEGHGLGVAVAEFPE
jgi:hypothetical protein